MKNQWGWGGYTTQDLARCRLSALAVALIYNWWSSKRYEYAVLVTDLSEEVLTLAQLYRDRATP